MIVAHHYSGGFGAIADNGIVAQDPFSANSIFLYLFGMWGKTGINCFVLITGYFMCTQDISLRKFLKLYLWIITYSITITGIFVITGYQTLSPKMLLLLFPITSIHSDSFVSAFLVWWLFIPFLNVLVKNLDRVLHFRLALFLVIVFSVYPFLSPLLTIQGVNPICWFSTLYIMSSYIRKYPDHIYKSNSANFWALLSIVSILISMASVVPLLWIKINYSIDISKYHFISDSYKPFALIVAVRTFMWFNNIKLRYNKYINMIGASTFGVLLIHSISPEMRQWLWVDVFHCTDYYYLPLWQLILYSFMVVTIIYSVGTIIDRSRIMTIEKAFFKWFDKKYNI